MPRVVFPAELEISGQPERPDAVQVQVSNLILSNTASEMQNAELSAISQRYQKERSDFFRCHEAFPHTPADLEPDWSAFWPTEHPAEQVLTPQSPHQQLWCLQCQQVWCEFTGIKANRQRPVTFMDNVPLTLWISLQKLPAGMAVSLLADIGTKVALQLTHFQYLYLLRLAESLAKLSLHLESDTRQLMEEVPKVRTSQSNLYSVSQSAAVLQENTIALAVAAHHVSLSMVMPALSELDGSLQRCRSVPMMPESDSDENELGIDEASALLPQAIIEQPAPHHGGKDSPTSVTCDLSCCPPSDSSGSVQAVAGVQVPLQAVITSGPASRGSPASSRRGYRTGNSTSDRSRGPSNTLAKISTSFTKFGKHPSLPTTSMSRVMSLKGLSPFPLKAIAFVRWLILMLAATLT